MVKSLLAPSTAPGRACGGYAGEEEEDCRPLSPAAMLSDSARFKTQRDACRSPEPSTITWDCSGKTLAAKCNFIPHAIAVIATDRAGNTVCQLSPNIESHAAALSRFWEHLTTRIHPRTHSSRSNENIDDEPLDLDGSEGISSSESHRRSSLEISSPLSRSYRLEPKVRARTQSLEDSIQIQGGRKRQRSAIDSPRRSDDDRAESSEEDVEVQAFEARKFRIDDTEAVTKCLRDLLDQLQQLSCKVILKEWIKVVEPKKQANFPYIGSRPEKREKRQNKEGTTTNRKKSDDANSEKVPDWWPIEKCRHIEPDHVYKPERLDLAIHILRLKRKDGWVDMLSDSTKDKLLEFRDPSKDWTEEKAAAAARRRKILSEIYRVASLEEAYINGGEDGNTLVTVFELPPVGQRARRSRRGSRSKSMRQSKAQKVMSPPTESRLSDIVVPASQLSLQDLAVAITHENKHQDSMFHPSPLTQPPRQAEFDRSGLRTEPVRYLEEANGYHLQYNRPPQVAGQQMFPELPPISMDSQYDFDGKTIRHSFTDQPQQYERNQVHQNQQSAHAYNDWQSPQSSAQYSPTSTQSLGPVSIPLYQASAQSLGSNAIAPYETSSATLGDRLDYVYTAANDMPTSDVYSTSNSQTNQLSMAPSYSHSPVAGLQVIRRRQSYHTPYVLPAYASAPVEEPHSLSSPYASRQTWNSSL